MRFVIFLLSGAVMVMVMVIVAMVMIVIAGGIYGVGLGLVLSNVLVIYCYSQYTNNYINNMYSYLYYFIISSILSISSNSILSHATSQHSQHPYAYSFFIINL